MEILLATGGGDATTGDRALLESQTGSTGQHGSGRKYEEEIVRA